VTKPAPRHRKIRRRGAFFCRACRPFLKKPALARKFANLPQADKAQLRLKKPALTRKSALSGPARAGGGVHPGKYGRAARAHRLRGKALPILSSEPRFSSPRSIGGGGAALPLLFSPGIFSSQSRRPWNTSEGPLAAGRQILLDIVCISAQNVTAFCR